ncbi:protein-disulfide reductase DsbD [Magnetospira sp. QH-2]|uniref:protein-disulfide reductase DsbD family protein n=1 Tax=Magnetospira sp. (strain QH-2) TaxID=1288970 RepID=UPI0003E813E8|nr:protein-disulfide reductase DsbD domain-containing protein [Magnetospira sp. QH-2]CCQ74660.1 putative thiol:disulfide interchange protein DsbD [Magnetospira sp. QH-2]
MMIRILMMFLLTLGILAHKAQAAGSDWIDLEHVSLRLIAADNALPGDEARIGLHFKLQDEWKIYWRSPGDAGFPPQVKWQGSKNLAGTESHWPAPIRFSTSGIETIGYKHEVVLPMTARLETAGEGLSLRGNVDFLACAEICIPYQTDISLDLPGGQPTSSSAEAFLIEDYMARVPGDGRQHGLSIEPLSGLTSGEKPLLIASAQSQTPFDAPDLYVEGPPELIFGKPQARIGGDGRLVTFQIPVDGLADHPTGGIGAELTLTLVDGERSAERSVQPVQNLQLPEALLETSTESDVSISFMLLMAVVGGLILNLMPCVLPVLSIKLLGVIGHGGGDPRTVRLGFIASAAGIVATFMVLAGALIGLKQAGAAIGWGIQFQHPWFLTGMALLVTLFACNLWGWFEIRLPQWLNDLGAGSGPSHGMGGHFLTGAFATLLATPCSAPFLGTAVGFALARGGGEILAVFIAIGLGMALPYLLVALRPTLATRLPKPGPWMITLKKVLALALAATAVWLVTVMIAQIGRESALVIGLMLLAMVGLFALRARLGKLDRVAPAVVVLLALGSFWVPRGEPEITPQSYDGPWKPFDLAAIPALIAEGKTVFVDVTADWCITCQVNKAAVLAVDPVHTRLGSPDVVAMKADWTRPSDTISAYLAQFGRFGIPFNVVYGKRAPLGLPLPELLTTDLVMEALDKAAESRMEARQ